MNQNITNQENQLVQSNIENNESPTFILKDNNKDTLIILLHGGPGLSCGYFDSLINRLSINYDLFSYDQGTQLSEKPQNWSISNLVIELHTIIKKYSNRKIYLLAHSFGSVIAINYALKYFINIPLILISWIYDSDWLDLFQSNNRNLEEVELKLKKLNETTSNPNTRLKNRLLTYASYYFPERNVEIGKQLFNSLNYYPQITLDIESKWINEVSLKKDIENLRGPIVSIAGIEDKIVFPDYVAIGAKLNLNVQHFELATGHFPFIDDLENTALIIEAFIKNNP